jgi:8-oxo-dGTP pyrophosphatase MutT (NUDIX family)
MTVDDDFREPHLRAPDPAGRPRDFLGAFGLVERDGCFLMTKNLRRVHGVEVETWDLPGGQVEPAELVPDALVRELLEETALTATAESLEFAFLQEGERVKGGRRVHAWRSFFFRVHSWSGEARAGCEVLDVRWFSIDELRAREPAAPYHDTFHEWLRLGQPRGHYGSSSWVDP